MNNVIPLPVRFRPRLVTPSEAFAAREFSHPASLREIEEQEERNRRNTYGAPVIMALYFGEEMK